MNIRDEWWARRDAPLPTLRLRESSAATFGAARLRLCLFNFQKYLFVSMALAVLHAKHLTRI
jgi:hypothetical protein